VQSFMPNAGGYTPAGHVVQPAHATATGTVVRHSYGAMTQRNISSSSYPNPPAPVSSSTVIAPVTELRVTPPLHK
jgi:hypothetical protein